MRLSLWLTVTAALVAVVLVVAAGMLLTQPPRPLLLDAGFSLDRITPNADGVEDVAEFRYSLTRNATVSMWLESDTGEVYAFRENEPRIADDYRVLFSGVVEGFTRPGETLAGEVVRRLLPDGAYTWRIEAVAEDGERAEERGTLGIADGDGTLPELHNFTVSPTDFTPNQDGIADRVQINVILPKPAELLVYLEDEAGRQYFVPELQNEVLRGEPGRHSFDYEGGVDLGADPPPDGVYTVVAESRDAVGQEMRQTSSLTLRDGGKPLAQIVQQPSGADVVFVRRPWDAAYAEGEAIAPPDEPGDLNMMAITMPVGDLLLFRLTVENYSRVPLRTSGPEPGTVYESFDERASTLGFYESSGAWRVGIDCENAVTNYPWRWAVGPREDLTPMENPGTGEVFYYLMPGERSTTWGAVRMTELVETSNPQQCWAGLIHEDVMLANDRVGAREVELAPAVAQAG